tara:strand:- start:778 stop:2646 length:1869 start_codon:yes stop_codon:yes gene_type:complete
MIRKISFILYILVILTFFPRVSLATTSENLNDGTKKIKEGATKVIDSLKVKVEISVKGKKLKQYFQNNNLNLSFNDQLKEYRFKEKNYEVLENNNVSETGKWKVHGLLKNQIKLKPDNDSKSYYFKKISKKDIIYHFDKLPGSEGAKKTLVEIFSSDIKITSSENTSSEKSEVIKKEEKKVIKKKEEAKKKKKKKKDIKYKELSKDQLKKLDEYEKLSKKIKVINLDSNSIEIKKQNIQTGQYVAANHCAKNNLFAYSFKDSGYGERYELPDKRAKFFYCTDQLIFVNPFTNKEVTWTNYVFKEYFKYAPENRYLYRQMTGRYKRMFEEDKKKNPKKYRFQPFKIIYKDENSIHITGEYLGDQNRERYLANEHCSKFNKKYYYFEDSFQQGRFGSMLFLCSNKHIASNPISGLPLMYISGSENYSPETNNQDGLNASQMLKYNSTNNTTFYFFEASDNLMKSLELLYRAYDQNVEADKLKAQISYNRQSKYSEQDKLDSTRIIIDRSSKEINAKISDASLLLSDAGRGFYEQSLPYAFNAAKSSYTLIMTVRNTFEQGTQNSEAFLEYANEFIGFFAIAKDLPKLAGDIYKTSKLVFSGAKSKKIRDSGSHGKALNELNLDV